MKSNFIRFVSLMSIIIAVMALPNKAHAHLDDGLIAYYPFNGNANDESGNGNDGSVYEANLIEDRFENSNSAYYFDGVDDYIDISPAAAGVKELHSMTISLWIKPAIVGDIYPKMLLSLRNNLAASRPRMGICYGELNGGDSGIYYEAVGALPDEFVIHEPCSLFGVWSNIVITADETATRIYINGVEREVGSGNRAPGDFVNSFSQFWIGRLCNSWYNFAFNGVIDDVRIYGRILPESEIQELYSKVSIFPDDSMSPNGAVHAHDNMIWPPNNKMVSVAIDGYVKDELSVIRDGGMGIGVSSAYLLVDGVKYILLDNTTNVLGEDGKFNIPVKVKAVKGAMYNIELYAADTEKKENGGPNFGLVDSTYIRVPYKMD